MYDGQRELFTLLWQKNPEPKVITLGFQISGEADLFKIHFPNMPIVPGACLLGLVLDQTEKWQSTKYDVDLVERANFRFPVTPGMRLELDLRLEALPENGQFNLFFRYSNPQGHSTQGSLILVEQRLEAA
ncbi:hypothetical protein [Pseudovibrio sp. WM33]|uniref:hypothetical protein n=1 Tax=Pseudovibrio sp. WM33 TaxID=1735585 RepID=UPI0007AEC6F2|nr:hypothetical protein [Pseudovibrio sp. WM33]KZL24683.1 hypothetical protein PsWM33_02357 [Pseudovibrio sp. WM33]